MAALNGGENSSQYEKCRERKCQPVHHEVLHAVGNVSLKVRHPSGTDAATWQWGRRATRREPTGELRQREKHHGPEHLLLKITTDECTRDGPLPQAQARQYEADYRCRRRKKQ